MIEKVNDDEIEIEGGTLSIPKPGTRVGGGFGSKISA
jgi:hypothetical protein